MPGSADDTDAKASEKMPKNNDPQNSWAELARKLQDYDAKMIEAWEKELDTLFVFAGLFSAALTAFNVELYSQLQPDPNQSTALLLNQISQQLSSFSSSGNFFNSTVSPFDMTSVQTMPSRYVVRVNSLWFSSLVLSLATSSMAMLVKQWLREYMTWMPSPTMDSVHVRCLRYEACEKWKLFQIAAFLPTLLQVAFVLFLLGLIDLLRNLNNEVAAVVTSFIAVFFLSLAATTILPVFFEGCPFRSPQAAAARFLYQPWRPVITATLAIITPIVTSSIISLDLLARLYIWRIYSRYAHSIFNLRPHVSDLTSRYLGVTTWRGTDIMIIERNRANPALPRGIVWAATTFSDTSFNTGVLVPIWGSWEGPRKDKFRYLFDCLGPVFDIDFSTWTAYGARASTRTEGLADTPIHFDEKSSRLCDQRNGHLDCQRSPIHLLSPCHDCANFAYALTLSIDLARNNLTYHSFYRLLSLFGIQYESGHGIGNDFGKLIESWELNDLAFQPTWEDERNTVCRALDELKIDMQGISRMLNVLVALVQASRSSQNDHSYHPWHSTPTSQAFQLLLHAWDALLRRNRDEVDTEHINNFITEIEQHCPEFNLSFGLVMWTRFSAQSLLKLVKEDKQLWRERLLQLIQRRTRFMIPDENNFYHPIRWPKEVQNALKTLGDIYEVDFTSTFDQEQAMSAFQTQDDLWMSDPAAWKIRYKEEMSGSV